MGPYEEVGCGWKWCIQFPSMALKNTVYKLLAFFLRLGTLEARYLFRSSVTRRWDPRHLSYLMEESSCYLHTGVSVIKVWSAKPWIFGLSYHSRASAAFSTIPGTTSGPRECTGYKDGPGEPFFGISGGFVAETNILNSSRQRTFTFLHVTHAWAASGRSVPPSIFLPWGPVLVMGMHVLQQRGKWSLVENCDNS